MPLFSRRRLFAGFASISAVAGVLGVRNAAARYYDGPPSDHFDGTRFFDVNGPTPRTLADQWRWWREGKRAKWPEWAPSPYSDTPPRRVEGAQWRISYVGHASLLIQTAGLNILLDPVWSERASPFRAIGPKRVNDPGIAFAKLPPIDVVLVTHAHYDHLDVATLSQLNAAHRPRIITPLGNDTIMRNHDAAARAPVEAKALFHSDDEWAQRHDDQHAAQLPDERLPGRNRRAGPQSDQLIQTVVETEQDRERDKQRPTRLQPAGREPTPLAGHVFHGVRAIGAVG